jgi:hypothetical protein
VLGFAEALTESWVSEKRERRTIEELVAAFPGVEPTPELLARLDALGVLTPDGDAFLVRSPRLVAVLSEVYRAGVTTSAGLDTLQALQRHAQGIAELFVRLFEDYVFSPEGGTRGTKTVVDATRDLHRLRSIALMAVVATYEQAMEDAVARARSLEPDRRPGRPRPRRR